MWWRLTAAWPEWVAKAVEQQRTNPKAVLGHNGGGLWL